MTDIQLPAGFTSVDDSLPDEDRPVLAIRQSGYVGSDFEVLTARYQPTYRPRAPWRDLSGDGVDDSGRDVVGWRYADEWLTPGVVPAPAQLDGAYLEERTAFAKALGEIPGYTLSQIGDDSVDAFISSLYRGWDSLDSATVNADPAVIRSTFTSVPGETVHPTFRLAAVVTVTMSDDADDEVTREFSAHVYGIYVEGKAVITTVTRI